MNTSNKIPLEICETWDAIYHHVVTLHFYWIVYKQLYGSNESRVDTLNKAAPAFFFITQNTFIDYIQLYICKLTDPAEQQKGKKQNLTLERLLNQVKDLENDLHDELESLLNESIIPKCKKLKTKRNKEIAHLDFNTALAKEGFVLSGVSQIDIDEILENIRLFMNKINELYSQCEIRFQDMILRDDGESLLYILENGLRYEELRIQALENGEHFDREFKNSV